MSDAEPRRDTLYATLLDALPDPVLIVDDDLQIQDANPAARPLLGAQPEVVLRQRSGEALHCLHAATAGGCGRAAACTLCVVRQAVGEAFRGQRVVRRAHKLLRLQDGRTTEVFLRATAAPCEFGGRRLALLILEDINELVDLRRLLPICANCKKIRNDQAYWERLESYFKEQLNVDFTHGICPDCVRQLYPQLAADAADAPDKKTASGMRK